MKSICDYMIIQRESDGYGYASFSGVFENIGDNIVVARVVREDDNMAVIPWQKCEINGNEWKINLKIPQGGLYRAEARLAAAETHPFNNFYDWAQLIDAVYHIGVGDIFIMAGQSNMSGYAKDPAYDPPQLGVHLFDNSGNWVLATHPLNSVAKPVYCNNDSNSGVSPGLAFGKMMARRLGVPVGLVSAARGGSSLESWNPAEAECDLYDAMCRKIDEIGKFTGIIWYQGCNETGDKEEAETYYEKFEQTLSLWRKKFGNMPVAVCQINRHAWKGEPNDRNWGLVREAQRRAGLNIPNVFVVPTIDMYTVDGIHNGSGACITIGERLASAMLKGYYKKEGSLAPNIKEIIKLDNRTVKLYFDRSDHVMRTMDDIATGMNIEDENGMMKCTKICVTNDGATVTAERDIGEKAVFHAYWEREVPAFFIRDIYGMPMLACFNVEIKNK